MGAVINAVYIFRGRSHFNSPLEALEHTGPERLLRFLPLFYLSKKFVSYFGLKTKFMEMAY